MSEQFGKYQLIRRIGAGGMAEVFLARTAVAQGLAKDLVIKKIHPAYARSKHFLTMFVAEAKIALGLNHPNIVQVFDFGAVGGTYFLAMEYVEGVDMLRLLHQTGRSKQTIPLGLCAHMVREVAKALDYAHRKCDEFGEPLGIVHRDVSLQNVLVSWDGAVKLVDFGIARARGVHEEEGVVKGKFAYMSPEQARGERVDLRSDVYSTGVILFELCCGRPLFPGRGKELLNQVRAGAIVRPRQVDPRIPESLEAVMLRALAFHPDDRYATARDLHIALGQFQLDQARSASDIIDSEALARFLAEMFTPEQRGHWGENPAVTSARLDQARSNSDILTGAAREQSTGALLLSRFDTSPSHASGPRRRSAIRERKHVMVLEGHIRGLSKLRRKIGTAQAEAVTMEFFKIARDIAFKYYAYPRALGEDSLSLICGLPVAAEDDASRTIRMALDLIDALDGIGQDVEPALRLAVGVQRGAVVISRGSDGSLDVDMDAYESALAMQLARRGHPAEILVGSQVYRLARGDWYFEELQYSELSDSAGSEPGPDPGQEDTDSVANIRVHRLRGAKERAARLRERQASAGDLVGRDLELKALRDAYRDALTSGTKRVILVTGEAGIGKRALINSFLAKIPRGEAVVRRAAGQVATAYTPYSIIADFLRDLLGLAEGAEPHVVRSRVERMVEMVYAGSRDSREARGARAALGMLLGVAKLPDDEHFDPEELRQRLLDVMLRVERTTSPGRLLILVGEDVHWADDDSITLCRHFFRAAVRRPVLGLFTCRPESRIAGAVADLDADIIRLDELDTEHGIELITRRFTPGVEADELARQILDRAGGNPLFIREVLDSLIERGVIVADGVAEGASGAVVQGAGGLRWKDRDVPIQVPTSIEALLATRIDHLPDSEKTTLLRASVLGRTSRIDAIADLLGRPVDEDLRALVGRGLIVEVDGHYHYRNDMTMSVAYGLLPVAERARLHRKAASRMIESSSYRTGQDDAVIARHLELAGDEPLAADRYLAAATHAIGVGGNSDALRQLNRALKLLPGDDHTRRFAVHAQREELLGHLGRRTEQRREIRKLLIVAEALGEPEKLATAHIRLARLNIAAGDVDGANRAIAPATGHAEAAGDPLVRADVLLVRALIARVVGAGDEALELCDRAMELFDDDPAGMAMRAEARNARGAVLWNMGQLEAAVEAFAEGLVIYRMLEMPRREWKALNNMGIIFASMGEFESALAHYKSALQLVQRLGDRHGIAVMLCNIGQTYGDIGDADRAERYLGKAIKMAESTVDQRIITDALVSLGQVYIERGEYGRAIRTLERGLEMARRGQARYEEIRALVYLAMSQLEAGESPEAALELAREASDLAESIPMPVGQIYGLAIQGMALDRLGEAQDAVETSSRAVALQAAQKRPEGAEQVLFIHAKLCLTAGRWDDAEAAIRAAQREVEEKATRFTDKTLQAVYLESRTVRAIRQFYENLLLPS